MVGMVQCLPPIWMVVSFAVQPTPATTQCPAQTAGHKPRRDQRDPARDRSRFWPASIHGLAASPTKQRDVLYAGAYSTCRVPNYNGECVKVVFPLPNGNAMVIMRPVAHPDGSFSVVSHGERFGDPGFYFTVHSPRGVRARYLKTLRESIKVYCAEEHTVRADHVLSLWRLTFLRLHYRMVRKKAVSEHQALARTP